MIWFDVINGYIVWFEMDASINVTEHSPNCRLGLTSLHPIYFILAVLIVLNILA